MPDFDKEKFIEDEGYFPHYSLLEVFPLEVIFQILSHLEWYELGVVAQTCTALRDIVQSPALWQHISKLDFTKCGRYLPDGTWKGPLAEHVMSIVSKCPNAGVLKLSHVDCSSIKFDQSPPDGIANVNNRGVAMVMDEDEDDDDDDDDDIDDDGDGADAAVQSDTTTFDRLVLEILHQCPHLSDVNVEGPWISNTGVTAIAAKLTRLRKFGLVKADQVTNTSILDLVSNQPGLKSLSIEKCHQVGLFELKHSDPNKLLGLTDISFVGIVLSPENVEVLARNCPNLTHLNLSDCNSLSQINSERINGAILPKLETLAITNCRDLRMFELFDATEVKVIDLTQCVNLRLIHVRCVSLERIVTDGCESLLMMQVHSGNLSDLTVSSLPSIHELHVHSVKLKNLDISGCLKLTMGQGKLVVPNLKDIETLNISGCRQLSPDIVNRDLLPQLTSLKTLRYGGHSWNSASLRSESLRQLTFENTTNVQSVALAMPQLEELHLVRCRDFTEMEMMDGILLGKVVKRFGGLVSKHHLELFQSKEDPSEYSNGTQDLRQLSLAYMQNLQGDILSARGIHFKHLTNLELISCIYLRHLDLSSWPSLEVVVLESCSHLSRLKVIDCDNVTMVSLRWCGMVETLELKCPLLDSFDVTGSSFTSFIVHSDKLQQMEVTGICTTPTDVADIRCPLLQTVQFMKSDSLTNDTIQSILALCPVKSLTLTGCHKLSDLHVGPNIQTLRLTALRRLSTLSVHPDCQLCVLALNNLPKITPGKRAMILEHNKATLKSLEVRAIPNETQLDLHLPSLTHLTLDQGIHLMELTIICPQLRYLRIQGCPRLSSLHLHVKELPLLQVDRSSPLLALKTLHLSCYNVKFLGRVLGHYTPNLTELVLKGDNTSLSRIVSVGHSLPYLTRLTLKDCEFEDELRELYPRSFVLQPIRLKRRSTASLTVMFE